ncbi:MAG: glyoxalase/bleomycin resistance/dioxygenase family protein [Proteobacteria bacterium]|nr:glyoxalase/bleomycin resistance/dioxygenase family protein [Pseudomonadota bacterium]
MSQTKVPTTGRVQLALNVTDLESSVDFYTKLLGVPPAKRKPGYANFAVAIPPLKLVLFESEDGGTINHLGVEVPDTSAVDQAIERLEKADVATDTEADVSCCYARQDKVWATGPDGERWEYYTVLGATSQPVEASEVACCA